MKFLALTTLVLAALALDYTLATDYCDPNLCPTGKHIGCGHSGEFAPTCPSNAEMVPLSSELKNLIVHAHNARRDLIAGGNHPRHGPACRMATMTWDDELAALAALNVRQCSVQHDECCNTKAFEHSGQNIAWLGFFPLVNHTKQLTDAVEMWYSEVEDSNMDFISKYPADYNEPVIGHFTIIVSDKNTKVGCAAAMYTAPEPLPYKIYLVTCNYATTNIVSAPIYKACIKPTAKCKTGRNPTYTNLCSVKEEYDVNKIW